MTNEQIRELLKRGLSTEDVAAELGVAPGKVAAIKAHMTMGTYDRDRHRSSGIYLVRGTRDAMAG